MELVNRCKLKGFHVHQENLMNADGGRGFIAALVMEAADLAWGRI